MKRIISSCQQFTLRRSATSSLPDTRLMASLQPCLPRASLTCIKLLVERNQREAYQAHQSFVAMHCLFASLHEESIGRGYCKRSHLGIKTLRKKWNSSTCGRASGLDSKMTIRTPIGTVFWTTSRLLEILVLLLLQSMKKEWVRLQT